MISHLLLVILVQCSSLLQCAWLALGRYQFRTRKLRDFEANQNIRYRKLFELPLHVIDRRSSSNALIWMSFPSLGLADSFWLAGTDVGNESNFYWMGHSEPMTLTHWHGGEPNNLNWNQDCLTIKYWPDDSSYQWDDDFCSAEFYFICEERTITHTNLSPGTVIRLCNSNLKYLTNNCFRWLYQ